MLSAHPRVALISGLSNLASEIDKGTWKLVYKTILDLFPNRNATPMYNNHNAATKIPTVNIEEIYGTLKKPRTFKQWEDAAKENTRQIKEFGSPSPLVWVLVHGKDIPPNAIVGGEDRRRPLYIARTFYEGGICVGKAGHHLDRGATIPYNGSEVHVDTFEVLVPALQPLRYSISTTISMPAIPRMLGESHGPPQGFERLNLLKTVILVDDSHSMAGGLWRDAREALAGIADLNSAASTDGVDLYFMNDARSGMNLRSGSEVRQLFDTVNPVGETPTSKKLQQLFAKYIPLVEDRNGSNRPIAIVVITDGVPTDDPKEVIIAAARRLDQNAVPYKKFGVQFVQIGDDPEAAESLQELDDDLAGAHGIRDMVDTTPYDPRSSTSFTSDKMLKILLGAIDEYTDELNILN